MMTREEFIEGMNKIKCTVISSDRWSCFVMEDVFKSNTISNKYEKFLKGHQTNKHPYRLLNRYDNGMLSSTETQMRRYLILDFFEQEVLATGRFLKSEEINNKEIAC